MNAKSSLLQAAIVLKSLPKAQVAKILSRLEAADIQAVLDAIKKLEPVSADQISETAEYLHRQSRRWKKADPTWHPDASNPVSPADNPQPESHHPFDFLVDAPETVRDRLVFDEHPRNIAIILASLPPETASACMKSLEPMLRFSVLRRLCELEEICDTEVNELSYALRLRFKKMMNRNSKHEGISSAAEVLSCSDPRTQQTLLAYMHSSDPDLADELQRSLLTIEHLLELDDEEIQILLRNVDTSCWAPALKHASLELTNKILGNMAEQPAELLNQEMASIGDVDEQVARVAAKQIINAAVQLIREGKIQFSKIEPEPAKPLFPAVGPAVHFPAAIPTII